MTHEQREIHRKKRVLEHAERQIMGRVAVSTDVRTAGEATEVVALPGPISQVTTKVGEDHIELGLTVIHAGQDGGVATRGSIHFSRIETPGRGIRSVHSVPSRLHVEQVHLRGVLRIVREPGRNQDVFARVCERGSSKW